MNDRGNYPRRTLAALAVILGLSAALQIAQWTFAADSSSAGQSTEPLPDAGEENSSYCGIYCVYAALHGFEKRIDFSNLLQTKYVGTMYGSSIQELAAAVEDHGLRALPMMGLSRANLVSSSTPIVLHVSRPESPGYFGHWILFLGMEDGKAKILDAPHRPELVPVADILAKWDSVGLYISEQPLSVWRLKADSLLTGETLTLFAALLLVTALLHRWGVQRRVALPDWMTIPALLAVPAIVAVIWHLASEDGYVRNLVAVRTVIEEHRPSFLQKLNVPDLERALKDENVVIVDARYPRDFEAGHLPGAINVPVFTTQAERRKLLDGVPRDARVIVYCQSVGCKFDEALGSALVAEGIENVALFPGGWTAWEKRNEQKPGQQEAKP